ncbi:monofunctional biosynthetic peptidoglycan transglycosylase [uncultured Christiangramia sp.]|uniref:monofunctional biosynthetic peptidoglycan transglycosylase n=1 Tax=uncultured Christiangramia sp. TaxID=503836 RepID=UPI00260A3023|nr:monofunctional biosynthetic peptidoglycan transglycosylase [uncultured Christiangramia sp.]
MISKFFRFIIKILLGLFLFSIATVVIYKWVPVPFTPLMVIRYFENPEEDIQHDWVAIDEISGHLQKAVIASEDQNFPTHSGFDFEAIKEAMEDNRNGRKIRGASTISQQTAKNVFLYPGRTWFRKGLEAYFTFLIEIIWGKERILEVYLNSIEMGKGVYGAQAASLHWFGKDAVKLGAYEAAAIAAVLPNPRVYRASPASSFITNRKNWIVRQMQNLGKLSLD